jgi:molybdate transport system substrate-binding protein
MSHLPRPSIDRLAERADRTQAAMVACRALGYDMRPTGVKFMTVRAIAAKAALIFVGIFVLTAVADSAEIKVMSSAGFAAAYRNLAKEFERTTENKIVNAWGPSMGNTPQAVPNRIARGEPVDVVIIVGEALDELIKQGKVVASSRVDLARSMIAMAVRAGAAKPDISSVDAFKRALIEAKSIAYSDSASGVYLSTVLFPRLGIAEELKSKSKMIPADPVGEAVARGEFEIGFQQMSELIPVAGIDLVGPLPPEVQKITVFSAGLAAGAKEPEAGAALIKFLASPGAAPTIKQSGMEPVTSAEQK